MNILKNTILPWVAFLSGLIYFCYFIFGIAFYLASNGYAILVAISAIPLPFMLATINKQVEYFNRTIFKKNGGK
jgi:hypothetical protein